MYTGSRIKTSFVCLHPSIHVQRENESLLKTKTSKTTGSVGRQTWNVSHVMIKFIFITETVILKFQVGLQAVVINFNLREARLIVITPH